MQGHIHLSVVSVASIVAVVLVTEFFLHMAALKLGSSQNESVRLWGAAFANIA